MIPPRSGDAELAAPPVEQASLARFRLQEEIRKPVRCSLRVLIVEDSAEDAGLIVCQLRRDGYEPEWTRVDTEEEYLAQLEKKPDVILCDYALPTFCGMRALDILRKQKLGIPFILVSGTIGEEVAVAAIQRGAADYLMKDRLGRLGLAIEHARNQERLRVQRQQDEAALRDSEQAARAVVDALPAHIAILDASGHILSVNSHWRSAVGQEGALLGEAREGDDYIAICRRAAALYPEAGRLADGIRSVLEGQAAQFATEYQCRSSAGESFFMVRVTAFLSADASRAVIAWDDITARKHADLRIVQLIRVQTIMAAVGRAIVHLPDRRKLLKAVCEVAVEKGGFKLAWIGIAAPDGTVQPAAQAGEVDYLDGIHIVTADVPEGQGPVGTAIRENRPVVVQDIDRDARMGPWQHRARQFGLHYVAAFPLRIANDVVGSFQVYAPRADFFDETEIELLTQVSDDISFALTAIADLRARRQAEDALKAREAQLYSFVQQAPAAIAMFDRNMNYLAASQRWAADYGAGHEDLVGRNHYTLHPDLPERWKEVHRKALAGEVQSSDDDFWGRSDGSNIWLHWAVRPWLNAHGRIGGIIIMADDITDRKRLEQEIVEISAREQRRIGQDLHDDLCQWLAGTEFSASALAKDLEKRSPTNAARALRIAESVRQSLARARMLARGLAPVVIETEGLAGALRELASDAAEMFRVDCTFEGPESVQTRDGMQALHLYRIVQEAISNAVRHGSATRVRIHLESHNVGLTLRIVDNGGGIPDPLPQTTGMGLRTMHYRAGIIHATLAINRLPDGGTEVRCNLPQST